MSEAITVTWAAIPRDLFQMSCKAACKIDDGRPQYLRFVTFVGMIAAFVGLLAEFEPPLPTLIATFVVLAVCVGAVAAVRQRPLEKARGAYEARRGPVEARFDASGIRLVSSFGVSDTWWRGIDAVLDLGTGTGLRMGLLVLPIPNGALPEGLTPDAFRARLEDWRSAA